MPRVNIYIRNEDWDKWQSIEDKPFFISESINKLDLALAKLGKLKKQQANWLQNNKERHAALNLANRRKYRATSETARMKDRVRTTLGNAVRRGIVKKPDSCSACSSTIRIEAHHDDYSRPLEVRWFCKKCHVKVHYPMAHVV